MLLSMQRAIEHAQLDLWEAEFQLWVLNIEKCAELMMSASFLHHHLPMSKIWVYRLFLNLSTVSKI